MANRLVLRSRRLHGLSPGSVEPSPRRHRSNYAGAIEPVLTNEMETDPSSRALIP